LEREVERLRTEVNRLDAVSNKIKSIDEQLERLRENYKSNLLSLVKHRKISAFAEHLSVLEDRDSTLVHEIAACKPLWNGMKNSRTR
jgi:ABC-type phosphate transport system auxiliary subunit